VVGYILVQTSFYRFLVAGHWSLATGQKQEASSQGPDNW